jgi:hypothetical protein
MINTVILLVGILLLVLALVLRSTVFAKPTGTYETTIINKREQNTVIYTGVFIPFKQLILETTELHQIIVKKHEYDRINVGDRATITRYSNGQHRLQG